MSSDQIQVRQVTGWQASFTETEPGEEGTYTFQLFLDQGAEEYIMKLDGDDVDVLHGLFEDAKTVYFDKSRKVLMFGVHSVGDQQG